MDKFAPGTPCGINKFGDLYMDADVRPFFDTDCVIIKVTKAGLVQVSLKDDPKQVASVPQRNIDVR